MNNGSVDGAIQENFLGVEDGREPSRNRCLNIMADTGLSFFKNIGKMSDRWLFYYTHLYSSF